MEKNIKAKSELRSFPMEPCNLLCSNDQHQCTGILGEPCPPCPMGLDIKAECGHSITVICEDYPYLYQEECTENVEIVRACGHRVHTSCAEATSTKDRVECEEPAITTLPCGHQVERPCALSRAPFTCRAVVEKARRCGHTVPMPCDKAIDQDSKCQVMVDKVRTCGHLVTMLCFQDLKDEPECKLMVEKARPCGHPISMPCCQELDHNEICPNTPELTCDRGHPLPVVCGQACPPCEVSFTRPLSCGRHFKFRKCSEVEEDEAQEPCKALCNIPYANPKCGHTCTLPCHRPTIKCEPCQAEASISFAPCKHTFSIPCSKMSKIDHCHGLIEYPIKAPCGHMVIVPCVAAQDPNIDLEKYCTEPCSTTLACGHDCTGTCFDCSQGRFHVPCTEPCDRNLICGHTCDSPCSSVCPPCNKECGRKCGHGACKEPCGYPCLPCNEKAGQCVLTCPHHVCMVQKCGEPCTTPPCPRSCPKTLPCGHPCISFCGEPCPKLCRECDGAALLNCLFDGSSAVELDHRFIQLECGHCIEANFLKQWLETKPDDGEILRKCCLICRETIWACQRFRRILANIEADVDKVLTYIFGDPGTVKFVEDDIAALVSRGFSVFKVMRDEVPRSVAENRHPVHPFLLFRKALAAKVFRSHEDLKLREKANNPTTQQSADDPTKELNIKAPRPQRKADDPKLGRTKRIGLAAASSILELAEWSYDEERILQIHDHLTWQMDALYRVNEELCQWVQGQTFPLKPQPMEDLRRAMERSEDVKKIIQRCEFYSDGKRRHEYMTPEVRAAFDDVFNAVSRHVPYTQEYRDWVLATILNLDEITRHTLGITDGERHMITEAIGGPKGRYFKCVKGHIYHVSECGGATETGVCPECGSEIGGANHQVVPGNTLASEMDGAEEPNYPTALGEPIRRHRWEEILRQNR